MSDLFPSRLYQLCFFDKLEASKPYRAPVYSGVPEGIDVSNTIRGYPNNFVYSGYVVSSSISDRSSYGAYRSASGSASDSSYGMSFYSSTVTPGTGSGSWKNYGTSMRCIASN